MSDSAAWGTRDAGAVVVFRDRLWILGGWVFYPETGQTAIFEDVWESADGVDWQPRPTPPWRFGMYPMALATPERMLIMGGLRDSRLPTEALSNEIWSSGDGESWSLVGLADWEARIGGALVHDGTAYWILGGKVANDASAANRRNDVWRSVDGANWQLVDRAADWSPRAFHCAVVHRGRIWVISGGDWDARIATPDVWSSDDGREWRRHADLPTNGRIWHSCASFGGRIWVLGGRIVDAPLRTVAEIWTSADGAGWERLDSPAPPTARHAAYTVAFDDSLWTMGGSGDGYLHADVWRFVPR